METKMLLIRHGETEWNRVLRYQGQKNVELNDRGKNQAVKIAKRLAEKEIDVLYSSDLDRAAETADIIAEVQQKPVERDQRLREMDFGQWEGLNYDRIKNNHPERFKKWYNDPTSVNPPEGEYLSQFQQRIISSFTEIKESHEGEKIAIITHGGVIRVWLAHLLQMPLGKYWRLEVDNTSLSIVKFYDRYPVLKLLNSTSHLE